MYTKRIQIFHYGPIEDLDIEIPFNGDSPKPVVLVGAERLGEEFRPLYIRTGAEWSFARIDYQDGLFAGRINATPTEAQLSRDSP